MRIFHISDLHIGKQLHFYNLVQEQRYILGQIVERILEYRPDVLLIAGDIYDRTVPSGEAYQIFDEFLNRLADITPSIPVLIIAGNHDSAQRLEFASGFMEKHRIYISAQPPRTKDEYLKKVVLSDEYGEIDFYMFPFIKPGYVRHLFEDGEVTDYQSAYEKMLERENIDFTRRNVLIAHQFFISGVNKPQTCDSELPNLSVGGLDAIDTSVIKDFDYVALGHIHGAQTIGGGHIRYSGTPLKYSVSEQNHKKTITMVSIQQKGKLQIETIPLMSMHDVRHIKGELTDIIKQAYKEIETEGKALCDDYVSITLTDEIEAYRPKSILEEYYSHILEIRVDNTRTKTIHKSIDSELTEERMLSPMEAFGEFYQLMQQKPMSPDEEKIVAELLE